MLESQQSSLLQDYTPQMDLSKQSPDPLISQIAHIELDEVSPREAWSILESLVLKAKESLGD